MRKPVLAQTILRVMLPSAIAETVLADLDEEFQTHILTSLSGTGAPIWYWREAGSLIKWYLRVRLKNRPRRTPSNGSDLSSARLNVGNVAIYGLALRSGLMSALSGVGLRIVGAMWASRMLSGFFFGIEPRDPMTFGLVTLSLLAVSLFASYLPARRATRVDASEVLRAE